MLKENGCLSLQGVLSPATCNELLAYINKDSDRAKAEVMSGELDFDLKFGGVNCRGKGVFGMPPLSKREGEQGVHASRRDASLDAGQAHCSLSGFTISPCFRSLVIGLRLHVKRQPQGVARCREQNPKP
jgi:hypothetical protein